MSDTPIATTALPERFNTARRYGVLLVCEGAPESTRWWSVLCFLVRRFTNRRAYDFLPRWLWHPLVYAVVLPRILREQQKMYRSSWIVSPPPLSGKNSSCESKGQLSCQGSAAVVAMAENLGRLLEEWLAQRLHGRGDVSVQVEVGFYHRSGSVAAALERLRLRGHYGSKSRDSGGALVRVESEALIVLPLYPLHKAEFTGSVWDAVMGSAYFQQHHNIPTVHFLRSYAHHEAFLEAWHRHIRRYIGEHGQPDWLFVVFQGTQRYVAANGDTYRDEYTSTADQLRARLSAPWPGAGGARLPSPEDTAFFRGSLNESRIKTAFLGQGSEQLKEPRLDRVFLSIIRQLKSISARSSLSATPLTSVTNRGEVDSPFCESSAFAAPRLSRTPLPLDMAPTAFVVCPGEALDDAATVWKLQESLFPVVRRLGWRDVQYIPALNDSADHAEVLAAVVDRYLL